MASEGNAAPKSGPMNTKITRDAATITVTHIRNLLLRVCAGGMLCDETCEVELFRLVIMFQIKVNNAKEGAERSIRVATFTATQSGIFQMQLILEDSTIFNTYGLCSKYMMVSK